MPCVAIDLFCGIGGLTKGLSLAGIDVTAGFDIDESCRFTYEANNNAEFLCEDVTNIQAQTINQRYPQNAIRALVDVPHVSRFLDILVDIEKKAIEMISGGCYIHLNG